jgi:hypothetical protein
MLQTRPSEYPGIPGTVYLVSNDRNGDKSTFPGMLEVPKVPGLFSPFLLPKINPAPFPENKPGTFSCFLFQMEILARRL